MVPKFSMQYREWWIDKLLPTLSGGNSKRGQWLLCLRINVLGLISSLWTSLHFPLFLLLNLPLCHSAGTQLCTQLWLLGSVAFSLLYSSHFSPLCSRNIHYLLMDILQSTIGSVLLSLQIRRKRKWMRGENLLARLGRSPWVQLIIGH